MSFFDEDYVSPVTKLKKGFALRDLIAGTEFEIPDPENDDAFDKEDYESSSKFTSSEVESYINLSALDMEADESNNIVSFSELRKKMTSLTPDNKLLKLIKRQGTGSVVSPNSIVYIHYNGHVNLQEIPFDNSYLRRDRPERFQLGNGYLIDGLELGIRTMRKGEQAQFLMEHKYAFGKQGCPPRIPPEATVLYEVELFNFEDCAPEEIPEYLENIDRQSFEYCLKRAKEFHVRGNDCFKQNNEKAASSNYNKAVNLLLGCQMKDENEETEQKKMLLKLYTNLSVCYIKMKRPQKVCMAARDAIYADEPKANQNAKLLYNWGSALLTLGEYKRAADTLKSALKIEPNNATIRAELSKLENKKALYAEQEKIRFQKALGYKPVKKTESPIQQQRPEVDDSSSELIKLVREKIEEANSGKKVVFTPGAEVVNRIEDLCREFVPENLMVERYNSTIHIYRYEKK